MCLALSWTLNSMQYEEQLDYDTQVISGLFVWTSILWATVQTSPQVATSIARHFASTLDWATISIS